MSSLNYRATKCCRLGGAVIVTLLCVAVVIAHAAEGKRPSTPELQNLKLLAPAIKTWRTAIEKNNVTSARAAGERYDEIWNGIEVYVNARSLPLYLDMESDTQDAMENELEHSAPDFKKLRKLAKHLQHDFKTVYALGLAGPALNPLFDDVTQLRKVRAKLRIADRALKESDIGKSVTFFEQFRQAYPTVASLLAMRSSIVEAEIAQAMNDLAGQMAKSPPANDDMATSMKTLLERYNFALALHNAAARAADRKKTVPTEEDRQNLRLLQQLENELVAGHAQSDRREAARGAATGSGTTFDQVQPALEAKARFVNTAATLRTALVEYEKRLTATSLQADDLPKAYKSALEAVLLARHTLVGQFWQDPSLQEYLASLAANR